MTTYTDPPGMPDDERMTPAELKVVREFLGFSLQALADHLKVDIRTVKHWEQGKYKIPDGVRLEIEDLEQRTEAWIGALVEKLLDLPEPRVVTYRTDEEMHAAHPDVPFPASWHRAAIARLTQDVPGLSIVFASDVETPPTSPSTSA